MTYRAAIAAKMQNMTTEGSNNISYNNSNKTNIHYQQHKTSIKLVGDRQTNIATYRAAIAAKNPILFMHQMNIHHISIQYLPSKLFQPTLLIFQSNTFYNTKKLKLAKCCKTYKDVLMTLLC